MNKFTASIFALFLTGTAVAQNGSKVYGTFYNTRIIHSHSTEMLWKRELDVIIVHRFGNIGGYDGGHHSLWGFDTSSDIKIGAEYGISNDFQIGFSRCKGGGPWSEVFDFFGKYRIMHQQDNVPVSLVWFSSVAASGQAASTNAQSPTYFDSFSDRLGYTHQVLIARKFSERFSLQLIGGIQHRNLVAYDDINTLPFGGAAVRLNLTKNVALVGEQYFIANGDRTIQGQEVNHPSGLGIEIDTGGHIFHLNVSNSRGLGENQFIPHTRSKWQDGGFRFGFTISRKFKM